MKYNVVSYIVCICFVFCVADGIAQNGRGSIDTVFSFVPGTGQKSGQAAPYFPANIFGVPDTSAREDIPSVSPYHICSLGLDGVIVVGFKNAVLRDGIGADFTVFENAFRYAGGKKLYAEPAKIAVSRDGKTFVEFPFDSLSLRGCAGVQPTIGNTDPFSPRESGGDSFDLATIGMDSVRYIRITDIAAMVKNNPAHPYWDPTISGFDLDAVVALHLESELPKMSNIAPRVVAKARVLTVLFAEQGSQDALISLYAVDGKSVLDSYRVAVAQSANIRLPSLAQGVYIAVVAVEDRRFVSVVYYDE